MNVIVVVRVRIRTMSHRLTVMSNNLGEKTLVSSCAFSCWLYFSSANMKNSI